MKFFDLKPDTADWAAYANTRKLYESNRLAFEKHFGFNKDDLDLVLYHIYKLFSYQTDRGASYSKAHSYGAVLTIFRYGEYKEPGEIEICTHFGYIQMESALSSYTKERDFIRLIASEEKIAINGCFKTKGEPANTIKGVGKTGEEFKLTIINKDAKYEIKDESWHVFSRLIDGAIGQNAYKNIVERRDPANILATVENYLYLRGIKDSEDVKMQFRRAFASSTDLSVIKDNISKSSIKASLSAYLERVASESDTALIRDIKGLDIREDAIARFMKYTVQNWDNTKEIKLSEIPLSFIDYCDNHRCEFLDALNSIPDSDVDIYVVGLAYFATYCDYFGELTGRNLYGAGIYPKYSNYKLMVAIKSKVLGLPLVRYAKARYVKNGENTPQVLAIFKAFGFDIEKDQLEECEIGEIDTTRFKKLAHPEIDFAGSSFRPYGI